MALSLTTEPAQIVVAMLPRDEDTAVAAFPDKARLVCGMLQADGCDPGAEHGRRPDAHPRDLWVWSPFMCLRSASGPDAMGLSSFLMSRSESRCSLKRWRGVHVQD